MTSTGNRVQPQWHPDGANGAQSDVSEPTDVHGSGCQDVADEDKSERGLSGVPLFGQIVQVELGDLIEFLIRVQLEGTELFLGGCGGDVLTGAAVQPVGPTVVDDRRLLGDPSQTSGYASRRA